MKKHYLLLAFIIVFISLNAYSQGLDKLLNVKYKIGYAILNNGDTLRGNFEFNDCEQNYQLLVFIDPTTLKKSAYEPQEVKRFGLDSMAFYPKQLDDKWIFMRMLINDSLKVFLNKHFYANDNGSGSTNEFLFEKPTGESILILMDNFYPFKSRVGDFFSDCPALKTKIMKNKYTNKNLFNIAFDYNNWLKGNKK